MIEVHDKGVCQVVTDYGALKQMTQAGWRLVAVLEERSVVPMADFENFPQPIQPYTGGISYQSATSTRHHSMVSHSFLLMLDEESALKGLSYRLEEAEAEAARLKSLEVQLKTAQADAVAAHRRSESTESALEAARNEVSMAKALHDEYKADVAAKLQAAAEMTVRKRTAYERIVEGAFDPSVEDVGADPIVSEPAPIDGVDGPLTETEVG